MCFVRPIVMGVVKITNYLDESPENRRSGNKRGQDHESDNWCKNDYNNENNNNFHGIAPYQGNRSQRFNRHL